MIEVLCPPKLDPAPDDSFSAKVHVDGDHHVVRVTGELDLASSGLLLQICTAEGQLVVVVEMAALTFMDCSGYGAFTAARKVLQRRNGSLTLANSTGEPAYLLSLIDKFDNGWDAQPPTLS